MTTDTNAHPAPRSLLSQLFAFFMGISIFSVLGGISLAVAAVVIH